MQPTKLLCISTKPNAINFFFCDVSLCSLVDGQRRSGGAVTNFLNPEYRDSRFTRNVKCPSRKVQEVTSQILTLVYLIECHTIP